MKIRYLTVLVMWLCLMPAIAAADDSAEKAAASAAQSWLGQIDAGSYGQSWNDASVYFQGAVTEKGWIDALNGSRKSLGKLLSRKLGKAQNVKSLPGAPDGSYVVMQYDTNFSNKKSAVETVTFVQEKDGKWKAAGYYIK